MDSRTDCRKCGAKVYPGGWCPECGTECRSLRDASHRNPETDVVAFIRGDPNYRLRRGFEALTPPDDLPYGVDRETWEFATGRARR